MSFSEKLNLWGGLVAGNPAARPAWARKRPFHLFSCRPAGRHPQSASLWRVPSDVGIGSCRACRCRYSTLRRFAAGLVNTPQIVHFLRTPRHLGPFSPCSFSACISKPGSALEIPSRIETPKLSHKFRIKIISIIFNNLRQKILAGKRFRMCTLVGERISRKHMHPPVIFESIISIVGVIFGY
jgi:hypothetical protein